jgi:tetratricopeptide (TPR) repeat protein
MKALAIGMAAAGLSSAALAGAAQAQVGMTVTGGGYSLACAAAAKNGETGVRVEELCTTALNVEPMLPIDRAGTFVNRGVIRLRAQRFNEAITDFDTALEYRADMAEAFVNRGAARIGMHRFAESLADFNKALALGVPEPEKAYYNRALAYEWLDDPKSAYLDYKKAQALAPGWGLVNEQLVRFTVGHAELKLPAAPNP